MSVPSADRSGDAGGVTRAQVRIAGDEYTLRGDEDPVYLQRVAAHLDRRLQELARANPRLSLSRVAVLCALNLADELHKLEEQYQRVLALLEREWERRRRDMEALASPVRSDADTEADEEPPSSAAPPAG